MFRKSESRSSRFGAPSDQKKFGARFFPFFPCNPLKSHKMAKEKLGDSKEILADSKTILAVSKTILAALRDGRG
jgi:hypothetical protein